MSAIRDGYGEGLVLAGKENKNIVAIVADLGSSCRAEPFGKEFPLRYFQVGISEQHMMSAAAGMAFTGKIPFINSFAAFSPGRNWDQLRVSVCYSHANVKIHGSHAGLTVGEDGATHQALEDIAITRVLPNLVVLVPSDALEAKNCVLAAAKWNGPVYIRTSRANVPIITKDKSFEIGKLDVLLKGNDCTIVTCGVMTHIVLDVAKELLEKGIFVEVLNCASIKPFDEKSFLQSIRKTKCCVSVEEHQKYGGLGSLVSEVIVQKELVPLEIVAVNDTFGESGDAFELLDKYGLNKHSIKKSILKVISRKQKNK